VVQRALARLEDHGSPTRHRIVSDFRRRRDRLEAKRDRRVEA